MLNLS
jgi:cytochrome P450